MDKRRLAPTWLAVLALLMGCVSAAFGCRGSAEMPAAAHGDHGAPGHCEDLAAHPRGCVQAESLCVADHPGVAVESARAPDKAEKITPDALPPPGIPISPPAFSRAAAPLYSWITGLPPIPTTLVQLRVLLLD